MSQLAALLALLPSASEGGVSLHSAKLKAFRRWFFFDESFLRNELPRVRFVQFKLPLAEQIFNYCLRLSYAHTGYHPRANYPSFPFMLKVILKMVGLAHQHFIFVPKHGGPTVYRSGLRQAVFHAWAHHLWEEDTLGYETDASLFYHRQLSHNRPLTPEDLSEMDLRQMHALRDYIQSDAESLVLLSLML
jgi:hypothetical protein